MKHAVLDAGCIKQAALIGVAEGTGHRVIRRLEYGGPAGPNPASIATIAELELEPGTYHVLRLACQRARSVLAWGSMGGTFSSSLASFEVRAGEVVNVGYLTAEATGAQKQLRLNLQDIPVLDLKRYAAERPAAYAAMVTRFAIPLPDKAQLCLYAQDEKAQGKRAQVPSGCT